MSMKSFFDRSFFINLFTMPLKGGEWEKVNKLAKKQREEDEKSKLSKPKKDKNSSL